MLLKIEKPSWLDFLMGWIGTLPMLFTTLCGAREHGSHGYEGGETT
jgi:hypothetical protein